MRWVAGCSSFETKCLDTNLAVTAYCLDVSPPAPVQRKQAPQKPQLGSSPVLILICGCRIQRCTSSTWRRVWSSSKSKLQQDGRVSRIC